MRPVGLTQVVPHQQKQVKKLIPQDIPKVRLIKNKLLTNFYSQLKILDRPDLPHPHSVLSLLIILLKKIMNRKRKKCPTAVNPISSISAQTCMFKEPQFSPFCLMALQFFCVQSTNEEKPPVTTVFVGNISERAPDMMIKQMLQVKLL